MSLHKTGSPLLCVLCASAVNVFPVSAGDLNPPAGPVAPTHKTLTQVEPRTVISAANTPGDATASFIISQPGSYYLTGNIIGEPGKAGIRILSDNVTLDLMGFSLIGDDVAAPGITMPSFRLGIVIRNGMVSGWGSHGISAMIDSGRIERITASDNGGDGILNSGGSYSTHIITCEAVQNIGNGISAGGDTIIRDCIASLNGTTGVPGTAGIRGNERAIIEACTAFASVADAFAVSNYCVVRGCRATGIGGAGIRVTGSRNRIEDNSISNSNIGLAVTGTRNMIRGNHVAGASDAYQFAAGNDLHLILSDIPESIDWPAHVTLAGTLTGSFGSNGITITSDDVTLDLGGHALVGIPGSLDGIASARRRITIRNGSIRNWGGDGIDLSQAVSFQCDLSNLYSTSNGGSGFRTGGTTNFLNCNAVSNSGDNFNTGSGCRFESCTANSSTTGHGFVFLDSEAINCRAMSNAISGFRAQSRSRLSTCEAISNSQHGIHITDGGIVDGCIARNNGGDGVRTDGGGGVTIRNNNCGYHVGATAAGIRVAAAGECFIEGNHCMFNNGFGIRVEVSPNTIIRNTCIFNGTSFSIVAGNIAGPIVNAAGAAAATNPLSNFSN